MKLLRESPGASMSMTASSRLRSLLEHTLRDIKPTHVLETGTYRGLGSTTFVAEAFPGDNPPERFVTIEANWESWIRARRNLKRFPFVEPVWGNTVPVQQAIEFIENDEVLRKHNEYPDIYIDDIRNPIQFYRNEVQGKLGGPLSYIFRWLNPGRFFTSAGDSLLQHYLRAFHEKNPLIVLDSAGGIGFLEFSVVEKEMRDVPYLLLLDDINHVKHFRSYRHVQSDHTFTILGADEREAWLFARHEVRG